MAQAEGLGRGDGFSHDQILDSILRRDDIAAAKAFVDALARAEELPAAALRSMNDRIWRTKVDRMAAYSKQLREAIVRSDFQAVRDYSERMRRLAASQLSATPAPADEIDAQGSAAVDGPMPDDPDEPSPSIREARESSARDEDHAIVERMRKALEEDRLLPPAENNAFDLAVARLPAAPNDPEAHAILGEVVVKQQGEVLARLQDGRPELALALANQLLASLSELDANAAWSSSYRSQALRWADDARPDIVASLIARTEQTIEERQLTIAPEGETSAQGYLELLASELGDDHDEVTRLAQDIIASYRTLIDQRLAKQNYESALRLHARLEALAVRFGVAVDQAATLRGEIETLQTHQQQHDQLMLLAARWRNQGQLIEPAGANALESAAKAIQLAFNPAEANDFLDEVIAEQRGRIDLLIREDRLREASSALTSLGAAIELIGERLAAQAAEYYAEAEQIKRRADAEEDQHRLQKREALPRPPASPPATSDDRDTPLIFVNPF
ncbi:MAG: hypothetical protein HC869_02035 [Rhodospirillales bacterium]|nr:hypothetical protein [Rhodospirillales bacterium]